MAGVLAIGIALSACGTAADSRQAGAAAERFYRAAQRHDGRLACAQLSPDTRAQLVQDKGKACARAATGLPLHGSRAAGVHVFATSAEVTLAGGDTVFLGYTRQGWRIEAFGCQPQQGGPYDCQEQG